MIETEITKMLEIEKPIIAAPMGPFCTEKLTVAVSEAGGLGVLSHITMHGINSTEEMKKNMEYVVEHTDKPFGFNIRTARSQPDAKILSRNLPKIILNNPKIKEQCVYLITSAGSPKMIYNKHFEKLKESSSNIKHFHVVPSLQLGEKMVNSGIDGFAVCGNEGGGHQSYENISTLVLLQKVRKYLPNIPIIACGGFGTGEGLASALAMGAGAIMMGSRFIASKECDFHENYKNVVVNSDGTDTKLVTGIFGPARVWDNKYSEVKDLVATKGEKISEETSISKVDEELLSLEKTYRGDVNEGTVYLGQSVGLVEKIESVASIINNIISDAEKCLKTAYSMIKKIRIKKKAK